jgi:hypothetical protein
MANKGKNLQDARTIKEALSDTQSALSRSDRGCFDRRIGIWHSSAKTWTFARAPDSLLG